MDASRCTRLPFPGRVCSRRRTASRTHGSSSCTGSDGGASGWNKIEALKWAQKGFAVLSYSYFGAEGTPTRIGHIDVDEVIRATEWLKGSPHVAGKGVGVYGVSRGGELAVLLASKLQDSGKVAAVIAHSPQARTQGSFTVDREGRHRYVHDELGRQLPAWKFSGQPIPDGTEIGLEAFDGGIFLTHGTADEVWSVEGTRELERRLVAAGRSAEVHYLEGERHGTSPARDAQLDAQRERFLRRYLGA